LILYRLAQVRFATLAGSGSALYPGRWNLPGQRAVYTSLEIGTCVLERLVHQSDKNLIPDDAVLMRIQLRGEWVEQELLNGARLWFDARSGCTIFCFRSLEAAASLVPGKKGPSPGLIAILVPSVVVPVYNAVLYPDAAGFDEHVALTDVSQFTFDPRLFPEGAIRESESR